MKEVENCQLQHIGNVSLKKKITNKVGEASDYSSRKPLHKVEV
jgi:hypothetical protein